MSNTNLPAFRGAGRLAYRTGGFPHHAVRAMRETLGRDLTTVEREAVAGGWIAERRETTDIDDQVEAILSRGAV